MTQRCICIVLSLLSLFFLSGRLACSPNLLSVAQVSAQAPPPPPPLGPPPPPEHRHDALPPDLLAAATELSLDGTTLDAIAAVLESGREALLELQLEVEQARQRLACLLEPEWPDVEEVMAAIDELGALETRLQQQRLRLLLQVRGLLNESQRKALLERR